MTTESVKVENEKIDASEMEPLTKGVVLTCLFFTDSSCGSVYTFFTLLYIYKDR